MLTCSFDRTLRVWRVSLDRATGLVSFSLLQVLRGHTEGVWRCRVVPWTVSCGGQQRTAYVALSGACDGTVRVWLLNTGTCVRVLPAHGGDVYNVDAALAPLPWAPAGGALALLVASVSSDEHVSVYAFSMPLALEGGVRSGEW